MPAAVLVEFDPAQYTGPSFIEGGNVVCFGLETTSWFQDDREYSRTQFPLTLAFAITIHKSQGLTLNGAVVDIGDLEYAVGLTYASASRVKSLSGIAWDPVPTFARLQSYSTRARLQERRRHEDVLEGLFHDTITRRGGGQSKNLRWVLLGFGEWKVEMASPRCWLYSP